MLSALRTLISALCVTLAACSTQAIIRANGDKLVNNNFLSAGTMQVQPDGGVIMKGTAERAAHNLGKYGGALLNAALMAKVINAAKDITTTVTK
jgi:hypothetical protein